MHSLCNSREHEVDDWKGLFDRAGERFGNFTATRVKENPASGVIVVEWTGQ